MQATVLSTFFLQKTESIYYICPVVNCNQPIKNSPCSTSGATSTVPLQARTDALGGNHICHMPKDGNMLERQLPSCISVCGEKVYGFQDQLFHWR